MALHRPPEAEGPDRNLINLKKMPFVRNRTQIKTLSSDSADVRLLVGNPIDQTRVPTLQ
jgi:hypothetical protein